ncbi:MAG: response regulator, partial [Planctomycetes bacterium]|nr:response regulator [Planctomycetota bacterium]
EALKLLRERKPALVVSDGRMPTMDGLELCRHVRADPALRDVPIVLVTALKEVEEVAEGLNAGADAYLTKPYNKKVLLSAIGSLLAHPPPPASGPATPFDTVFGGRPHHVRMDSLQALHLLLATYGNAVAQNRELAQAHQALRELHQKLEAKVTQQTAELKKVCEELAQARQDFGDQQRVRNLEQLASGVAHDINAALSPIVALSELLIEQAESLKAPAEWKECLGLIRAAVGDASHVANRLRAFYRPRAVEVQPEPLDLNEIVAEAVALTQPRWKHQAWVQGIRVRVEQKLQDAPFMVGCKPHLRDAVVSLILIAVDSMPAGGSIVLSTRSGEGCIILAVSYAGVKAEGRPSGPASAQSAKTDENRRLNMRVVEDVVNAHKGTLAIQAEPGVGATFTISLPIGTELAMVAKPPEPPAATGVALRILVVDDDAEARRLAATCLAVDKHLVDTVATAREAVEKVRAGGIDIVITGRALPDMRGDELAAAVKQITPGIRVLMLTGFARVMEETGETIPHVDAVLAKPLSLAKLREAIARHGGPREGARP